jgi:hypothetical protein
MDNMESRMGWAALDIKKKKNTERPVASAPLDGTSVIKKDAPILAAFADYDRKWVASGHYDFWGIASGVVKKRGGAPNIEVGLFAVGRPEY